MASAAMASEALTSSLRRCRGGGGISSALVVVGGEERDIELPFYKMILHDVPGDIARRRKRTEKRKEGKSE